MSKLKKIMCLLIMGAVFIGSFGTVTINASEINSQEINNEQNINSKCIGAYRPKIIVRRNADGSTTAIITEQELRKELKSEGYTDEQLGMLGLDRASFAGISVRVFGNVRRGNIDIHVSEQTRRVVDVRVIVEHVVAMLVDVYRCNDWKAINQLRQSITGILELNKKHAMSIYIRHWTHIRYRG